MEAIYILEDLQLGTDNKRKWRPKQEVEDHRILFGERWHGTRRVVRFERAEVDV